MNTVSERIEYLKKNKGLTYSDLAKELGISGDAVRIALKRNSLKEYYINIISEKFGISKDWIINGEGSMENTSGVLSKITEQTEQYITNSNGNKYKELSDGNYLIEVKVVPFEAFARYASEFSSNEAELFGEWENVTFMVDRIGLGNYLGFRVKGDSMDGGLLNDTPDKAIVLARELGRQHWNDGFSPTKYGWIIVTKDNILFKDIIGFDKTKGTIKCHSRNQSPEYSDFDYPLNDVRQIFKVIKRTM